MTSGSLIGASANSGRVAALWDGCVVALTLMAVSLAAVLSLPQAPTDRAVPQAIIFPPWMPQQDAVARSLAAGHRVLRGGISSFIVIAAAAEAGAETARPRGALLMLALDGLAGCLDSGASVEPSL
ncbi:hypothetical protein LJR009_002846 [Bosea sp. LjRoot9]|uniref:hypothetical protein n=1 Tax=Bosea sp. LjRoot9 TaxID=3342341 RepID=UPI003ECF4F04